MPITSLPARCVVLVLSACVDRGALSPVDEPPTDDIAVDTDRDTDTRVDDTDPPRRSCVPHELTWREQNAPRIGNFGWGGIAWHPSTGLRIWGGCDVDRERADEQDETGGGGDFLCSPGSMGPAHKPWPVRAERWRDVLSGSSALCMVRADGSFACRDTPRWTAPPVAVEAIGDFGDWVDAYVHPGHVPTSSQGGSPKLWGWTDADRDPLAIFRGSSAAAKQEWLCVHDDAGGLTCDGPDALEAVFGDPERCWVEVIGGQARGLCALDDAGDVACWWPRPDWAFELPPRRLHHLSIGTHGLCGLDEDGGVRCSGTLPARPFLDRMGFVDVWAYGEDICALDGEGRVSCAGPGRVSFSFANPDAESAETR